MQSCYGRCHRPFSRLYIFIYFFRTYFQPFVKLSNWDWNIFYLSNGSREPSYCILYYIFKRLCLYWNFISKFNYGNIKRAPREKCCVKYSFINSFPFHRIIKYKFLTRFKVRRGGGILRHSVLRKLYRFLIFYSMRGEMKECAHRGKIRNNGVQRANKTVALRSAMLQIDGNNDISVSLFLSFFFL